MTDLVQAFREANGLETSPVAPDSRYHGVGTAVWTARDGRQFKYLRRRFPPDPATLAQIGTAEVQQGDRPDLIAHRHLGDARGWWRIADANLALDPADLACTPSVRLRLTLPDGIQEPDRD
jgi:hypothetical protein